MKGNLNGLYTFEQVSEIYNVDPSTLRKMIKKSFFKIDKDVKKFGKTWIITEFAMCSKLGYTEFNIYKANLNVKKARKNKSRKPKNIKRFSNEINSVEIKTKDSLIVNEVIDDKDVIKGFKF